MDGQINDTETENPKPPQTKRMTVFALFFTILGTVLIFFLDAEKARELFSFFRDIIVHLLLGS